MMVVVYNAIAIDDRRWCLFDFAIMFVLGETTNFYYDFNLQQMCYKMLLEVFSHLFLKKLIDSFTIKDSE